MTKEIELTKGYVAIVDDDDYDRLSKYKWSALENNKTVYAVHRFKNELSGKYKMVGMHRFIIGISENYRIDHIDRNGLNNCKNNLRKCSDADNQHNKTIYKNNTTGYRGISFFPKANKNKPFTAHICLNRKLVHIGYFKTDIEAAKAYDKKAIELFGEFASLNFTS